MIVHTHVPVRRLPADRLPDRMESGPDGHDRLKWTDRATAGWVGVRIGGARVPFSPVCGPMR
jgi:hypothetical protein